MENHTRGQAGLCPPLYLETHGLVFGPRVELKPLANKSSPPLLLNPQSDNSTTTLPI